MTNSQNPQLSSDAKVHLAKGGSGNRSRCRYSSRPSRRIRVVSIDEFRQLDPARQCTECAAEAAKPMNTLTQNGNNGHGWVFPRPDGMKMRCGGPAICSECAKDQARKYASEHEPHVPLSTYESAVKGRQEFRKAYVDARKLLKRFVDAWEGVPGHENMDRLCEIARVLPDDSAPTPETCEPLIDWKASYEEALRQRDALQTDANRYRWLREFTYVEAYYIDGAGGVDTKIRVEGGVDHLDLAVDMERIKDRPAHAQKACDGRCEHGELLTNPCYGCRRPEVKP